MSFDRKAYMAEWREKNRERINELAKKYYAKNPEKHRAKIAKWKEENKEKVREYQHEHWLKTRDDPDWKNKRKNWAKEYRAHHQEKHRLDSARQREKFPDEIKAKSMVNHAIRDGKLNRSPCEVCGAEPAQGHHDDYNHPLKVRWLCQSCHAKWHRENEPIRKRKE